MNMIITKNHFSFSEQVMENGTDLQRTTKHDKSKLDTYQNSPFTANDVNQLGNLMKPPTLTDPWAFYGPYTKEDLHIPLGTEDHIKPAIPRTMGNDIIAKSKAPSPVSESSVTVEQDTKEVKVVSDPWAFYGPHPKEYYDILKIHSSFDILFSDYCARKDQDGKKSQGIPLKRKYEKSMPPWEIKAAKKLRKKQNNM